VGDTVEAWLNAHPHLVRHDRNWQAWKAAKGFWAGVTLAELDEPDHGERLCRRYLMERARSPRTVKFELEIVHRALKWKLKHKAPKLWFPPQRDPQAKYLTKEEFRRFLEGCKLPHVRLFAILAVTTGARPSAILEMTWDQVKFDIGMVELNASDRVQSHKQRPAVPMNDRLRAELKEAKANALTDHVIEWGGGPLGSIKKGIGSAGQRTGIKVSPYTFRHSACVWMAMDDVPILEIAQFLGHTNARMVERVYGRFRPSYLRKAAASLEW